MLVCSALWCCLLPCAKVPAPGRRLDVVPDVVPHAAQPVLKTRHSLGPPMLDVPACCPADLSMFRLQTKRIVWRKLWRLLIRRRMKSSCDTEFHAANDPMQSLKMVTYHRARQRYLPHVTPQASSWHQNGSHHHHGTARGSFTAKKWFGHRAGCRPAVTLTT